jgi:hypothetical protein
MDATAFPPPNASRLNGTGKPLGIEVLTPAEIGPGQHRPYVVKGLIARRDHAIAMGQPGSGKSAFVPYVAYAVAQDRPVFGRRVAGGPVVYLAAEDGHGMKNRVRALMGRHGDAPDFHLIPMPLNLSDAKARDALADLIAEIEPVLVVVDTIAKAFPDMIENESWSMGPTVAKLRDLAGDTEAAVWSVHHVAKDGGTSPRGHGSLAGDADVTMLIEGSGAETRRVRLGKNRNGPDDITFSFEVVIDTLGMDDDGDPIIAPVATEAEGGRLFMAKHEGKLSDRNAVLLRLIRDIDPTIFKPVAPANGMAVLPALERQMLIRVLIVQGWFPEPFLRQNPQPTGETWGLSQEGQKMLYQALTTLKRRGFLNFNRPYIWMLGH